MVTKKDTLAKVREIITKHYTQLVISMLGKDTYSTKELEALEDAGIDVSNSQSLLSLAYFHNFLNNPIDVDSPQTVRDVQNQQNVHGMKPDGDAVHYTIQNINDKTRQYIEKLKLEAMTRVDAIIRENNDAYKNDALKNLDRSSFLDEMVKESTLGKVKQKLKDTSGEANRDWKRVAITEMSNAIGIASADRIVHDNRDSDLNQVYVFRITVKDSKTCKYCKRFYIDNDGSPKLYRLNTLLSNGSNYGKKADSWLPVCGATHVNERCSGMVELKPGFRLLKDGSVTYIGLDKWKDYILQKLIV